MRVYLGSDHAGYELKTRLIEWLVGAGHEPVDCGPESYVQDDESPTTRRPANSRPPGLAG